MLLTLPIRIIQRTVTGKMELICVVLINRGVAAHPILKRDSPLIGTRLPYLRLPVPAPHLRLLSHPTPWPNPPMTFPVVELILGHGLCLGNHFAHLPFRA